MRTLYSLERILLASGIALLAFCAAAFVQGHVFSHIAVVRFQRQAMVRQSHTAEASTDTSRPDFTLWDQQRIQEYQKSSAVNSDQPQAVLRIDKIHLLAPVLNGTDDMTLNRAVGRIPGTAHIGAQGNVGIAGHRDGFFRGLKDVRLGDTVLLETKSGTQTYTIDRVQIVTPDDVSVLKSDDIPSLTLVTCYPFYFIGSAPQRYIVHASLLKDPKREVQAFNTSFKNRDQIKEKRQ